MSCHPEPMESTITETLPDAKPLRRSGRRVKPPKTFLEDGDYSSSVVFQGTSTTASRRNPKRKASEVAEPLPDLRENALEEALAPLSLEDIQDWDGWIELESEPAFFNIILRDLGVERIKAQEVFSIDPDGLSLLPQPVYGFIFLFQYKPEASEDEEEEDTGKIWFANQTTSNACATVALFNIIMNIPDAELGKKLREFYDTTKDLSTALRGHRLSSNKFIRTIHNSFTRRMDHLNSDLALENDVTEEGSLPTKKRAVSGKAKSRPKPMGGDPQYGFHFIAYIPADGAVWELDGLKTKPHKIGSVSDSTNWISVAQPQIEARMMQYEGTQLSFNLLALCRSALSLYSRGVAQAISSLHYLDNAMASDPSFVKLISTDEDGVHLDDTAVLSEFDLTKGDLINIEIPETLKAKISQPDFVADRAYKLRQELVTEVKAAMGEYRSEVMAMTEDEKRVKGRKKDYGPALHKWVQKLASKGVLEDVITSSS